VGIAARHVILKLRCQFGKYVIALCYCRVCLAAKGSKGRAVLSLINVIASNIYASLSYVRRFLGGHQEQSIKHTACGCPCPIRRPVVTPTTPSAIMYVINYSFLPVMLQAGTPYEGGLFFLTIVFP
jgi:hypothetical protein